MYSGRQAVIKQFALTRPRDFMKNAKINETPDIGRRFGVPGANVSLTLVTFNTISVILLAFGAFSAYLTGIVNLPLSS